MPIPAILGIAALGSLLASGAGTAMSAVQGKKNESRLMGQRSDLDTEYYQGALENAGAKSYLKRIEQISRDNMSGIDNSAVQTGATEENTLARKEAANENISNAISNLLQQNEANKRGYFQDRANLNAQMSANSNAQAQNWVNLAGNVAGAIGNLGEAYLDADKKLLNDNTSNQQS